ncbi:MAG TPA: hypothetical protein VFE30_08350 [Anaeromyxobacteraceae bacterium]|jgi:hypothetical protein|nr:hypothetical protein [Anaeromyxobacteraceae bacterium]
MTVCPVCEHAQEANDECEMCGKRFVPGPTGGAVSAASGDWLEPTAVGEVGAGEVALLDGLEPTRLDPVPVIEVAGPAAELEPTAAAPVRVVATALPDLEATAAAPIPGDGPSAVPTVLLCRYCRTPAFPGELLCGRCGMRLPVSRPEALAANDSDLTPCPSCGTPGSGSRCLACGDRRPSGG